MDGLNNKNKMKSVAIHQKISINIVKTKIILGAKLC